MNSRRLYSHARRGALAILAALALGCGRDSAPAGAFPPPRVASCDAEISAVLAELGAGPDAVGADSRSLGIPGFAAAADLGLDCERASDAAADLVLVLGTPAGRELAARLEAAERKTLVLAPRSVNEIVATHTRLGALLGRKDEAALAVGRLAGQVARIATSRDGRSRLTVVWVLERDPLEVVGALGLLHEILELAGAENGFHGEGDERLRVTPEEIAARAPDLVLDSSGESGPALALAPGLRVVRADPALARSPTLDVLGRVERLHAALYAPGG